MTSLQIGLAIVGGLVLAAVVAYNAWITRQSVPRTVRERGPAGEGAEPVSGAMGDPLAERREPGFSDALTDAGPEPIGSDDERAPAELPESGIDDAQGPALIEPSLAPLPERRPGPALDALIDVIAPLALEHEVSGDAVLAALPATRRVGSKPFAVEGLNAQSGEWEGARPHQRYRALQAGVQLANRAGPLNDIEFSEFVVKTQAFADAVGASPDFPDMRAEVARARELDAFASGHDAQLGFTLRARRAAWSPGYVSQHAGRLGFVAGTLPGRMVLPASQPGQPPVLVLTYDPQAAMADDPEQSALREVTLSLEVTHVARDEQPFGRLRQAAQALADAMDGMVTDDAGAPLPTEAMDHIGTDLESLYDALDERDLAAGSPQARRLFS
ncbi:MAG TPA: cell division protein ZipA C-terminal FtsZ-binding domain-containing protein [Hydrogenophaga sp.]|uniref:cell division protein ZipA C-terminal FtsZ-binding domain-containing protein n=1 Tax=Hydrogenophaga sp. TaxID=1904254 RepID=UPI002CBDC3F5|nr:cell division protein ZipA C-terminal FtsZ-binding domain-containing protein [Hydrogenophaga sp.]HSX92704.1 cell division protein ZipA C-terminal FtsZ-binding domain-containing protein [Hydrogenophaga sp.]